MLGILNSPSNQDLWLVHALKPLELITVEEELHEFVVPGTVVAIRRDKKGGSSDQAFWFMEVVEVNRCVMEEDKLIDDSGRVVPKGLQHLSGHFFEKNDKYSNMKKYVYNKSKKITYFFRESIMYPYVNMVEEKHGYSLSAQDYTEILLAIEQNGYSYL